VQRKHHGDRRRRCDGLDLLQDGERRGGIESRSRFVEEQRLRLGDELDRDGEAALLAST